MKAGKEGEVGDRHGLLLEFLENICKLMIFTCLLFYFLHSSLSTLIIAFSWHFTLLLFITLSFFLFFSSHLFGHWIHTDSHVHSHPLLMLIWLYLIVPPISKTWENLKSKLENEKSCKNWENVFFLTIYWEIVFCGYYWFL